MKPWIVAIATCLCCTLCSAPARPQTDSVARGTGSVLLSDGATLLHDAGRIVGAPVHFSRNDWLLTGSVLAGTALLLTTDGWARTVVRRHHTRTADLLAGIGNEYGREVYGLGVAAGLYAGGLIWKDAHVRETGLMLVESMAMAGALTTLLKALVGRSRPYREEGPFRFRALQWKTGTTSLPSGHTTIAFAASSVLAGRTKSLVLAIGLYSAAALTAFARVYDDVHWVSDNVLAAVIGTCVGLALVDIHATENESSPIRVETHGLGMKVEVIL